MFRPFYLSVGLTLGALAQNPPQPGQPVDPRLPEEVPTIQPGNPNAPAPNPDLLRLSQRVDPDAIHTPAGSTISQPNMSITDAAFLYEDVTGQRVVYGTNQSKGEVFFVQRGPLTNAEVADLLKQVLLLDGIAIVQDPANPNRVKLAQSGALTSPTQMAIPYITNPFDLPTSDEIVRYKMTFQNLKPDDAAQIFQEAFGQGSQTGIVAAVPVASSLIITENSALIRQMIAMQEDIDKGSVLQDMLVDVTYGDVEEMAQTLNEIYNNQETSGASRTSRAGRGNNNNGRGAPPTPGSLPGVAAGGGSGEDVPVTIIPRPRISKLLLIGRANQLRSIKELIAQLDVPSSGKNRQSFRLHFLRVGDFIDIASQAIQATLGEGQGGDGAGQSARRQGGQQNNRNANQGGIGGNNRNTGQNGGAGGANGQRASLNVQDIPTTPISTTVGSTLLVGDNVANSVIVTGPPHHIQIVRDLIRDLDTESQQVALTAVVGNYGIDNGASFGLDLAQALGNVTGDLVGAGRTSFGIPGVVDPGTLTDLGAVLAPAAGAGPGLNLYGQIAGNLGVFVNALETETRFKTLERGNLVTTNNRSARLVSGQRIAVPASSFAGGGVNGTSTNVEFRDVALEIEIQPLINSDDEVTLEISINRETLGQERIINDDLRVPDINREALTTSVRVRNGSVVVLGGIITEVNNESSSGIPILRRIPGIGKIFGSTSEDADLAELVIMIQPQIIPTSDSLEAYGERYQANSEFTGEAREAFPVNMGVLPKQGIMPAADTSYQPKNYPQKKGALKTAWPDPKKKKKAPTRAETASDDSILNRKKRSKIRGRNGRR